MPDGCYACQAALADPYTGHVQAGCLGCEIRCVSLAPKPARLAFYAQIRDYEEREAFATAVLLEHKRREAWKSERMSRPAANDEPAGPAAA